MSKDVPCIAVIDDEEPVRKALSRLLESVGMAVETFSRGAEFMATVATHPPDCAVVDLQMPEVSGLDVLAQLAKRGASVPVVVITGQDSPEAEAAAMRAGACAYLRKPVTDRLLLGAIAAAIANPSPRP